MKNISKIIKNQLMKLIKKLKDLLNPYQMKPKSELKLINYLITRKVLKRA